MLDQGDTPRCVGFSSRSFLDAAPIVSKTSVGPAPGDIYLGAQLLDEWPGTNYDGTSVRGAMKYLASRGEISSYAWGQSVDDVAKWMRDGYGTVLVGTNWYAEMSDVDKDGYMREPASSMATPIGGHAWHVVWYDDQRDAFLMKNSWGAYFGMLKNGHPSGLAYVRRSFFGRLLNEDGEVAAPIQVKLKPVKP